MVRFFRFYAYSSISGKSFVAMVKLLQSNQGDSKQFYSSTLYKQSFNILTAYVDLELEHG